jgi:hypothetical protein
VRVFARGRSSGAQLLVYSLAYRASGPALVAIPIAVPPSTQPEQVHLIDLPQTPRFFDDLAEGFPVGSHDVASILGPEERITDGWPTLKGREATFVQSLSLLMQMISHVGLPPGINNDLQADAANAFVLVTLPPGEGWLAPMALEFPRRRADQLRLPCSLIKGGPITVPQDFATRLYVQSRQRMAGWDGSNDGKNPPRIRVAGQFLDCRRSRNVVDPMRQVFHRSMFGESTERDTVVFEGKAVAEKAP